MARWHQRRQRASERDVSLGIFPRSPRAKRMCLSCPLPAPLLSLSPSASPIHSVLSLNEFHLQHFDPDKTDRQKDSVPSHASHELGGRPASPVPPPKKGEGGMRHRRRCRRFHRVSCSFVPIIPNCIHSRHNYDSDTKRTTTI